MKMWLFIAGINGALAVLAGAFAAHALGSRLDPIHAAAFATAAHYHLVHAVAMAVAALAARGAAKPRAQSAALLFLAGIVLFSGSLYLQVLTGIRAFAYITPVGGLVFVAAWILLALAALKLEETP
ncbi:MAG TPA: DUF423 domain-containing protein [Rhizomicrobium sp.]|jgi:uncharacterized membrane protein YgdD (TMEM256/DUF423 family)|nr:DUF423 domain-containing protein [Rhizomicrobium sp.]